MSQDRDDQGRAFFGNVGRRRDTMSRRADRKTSMSIPGITIAVPAITSIRDAAHVAEDL